MKSYALAAKTHVLIKRVGGAVLIALLASLSASAETWSPNWRTIAQIYPHTGGVSFILDGPVIVSASPCPNRFIFTLGMSNYSAIVAGLYSAHAQGKRIQINYDETNFSCDIPANRFTTEN
jgi:hypothetical protein